MEFSTVNSEEKLHRPMKERISTEEFPGYPHLSVSVKQSANQYPFPVC